MIHAHRKLLFTTGMTLVDSVDSILMLYSYTGFANHSWRIFEPRSSSSRTGDARSVNKHGAVCSIDERTVEACSATADEVVPVNQSRDANETENKTVDNAGHDSDRDTARREHDDHMLLVKRNTMSELSITLTTMSILLAFGSVNEVAVHWPD
jgi:high-affinity nickel-transport protein